jgi:hypothetical protein
MIDPRFFNSDAMLIEGKIHHRELIEEARNCRLAARLKRGPVICVALANLGEFLIRTGTKLQERYRQEELYSRMPPRLRTG